MVHDVGLLYEQTIKFNNITKQRNWNQYAQQDGLRKSCIKTTLDQYSGLIDALK